jgi:OmcA/MtrC family decaheme c-type cytochrome
VDFSNVLFPGDHRDCAKCHTSNSQQLPLSGPRLNVVNPAGYINPAGPVTAACTGCHTGVDASSHALSNTSSLGESCAVCHAADDDFSVDKVHALQ